MPLPTFLVVGAARCGTTTIHNQLAAHPAVSMTAVKEPNFFAFRQTNAGAPQPLFDEPRIAVKSVSTRDRYERLFRAGPGIAAYGDVSPLYLYVRESPALIAAMVPEARIVAVLRDPVERAYSHFLLTYDGPASEVASAFAAAVETEWHEGYTPFRSGTHVLRLGKYWEQLQRYVEVFPSGRMLVLDHADLARDIAATVRRICTFIGVDPDVALAVGSSYNASGIPRAGLAGRLETGLRRAQPYVKRALPTRAVGPLATLRDRMRRSLVTNAPPVDPAVRQRLLDDYYADDLAALEQNLGVRLVGR